MNLPSLRLCRSLIIAMTAATLGFTFGSYYSMSTAEIFKSSLEEGGEHSHDVDFRRQNARQLQDIALELKGSRIDARLLLALNGVIGQLDPRHALSADQQLEESARVADACGEEFKGAHYGHPFFREGFVRTAGCRPEDKPPMHQLVTALLLAPAPRSAPVDRALTPLRRQHPRLPAFVAATADSVGHTAQTTLERARASEFAKPGARLNRLVGHVRTPYVLLMRDAERVDELARVERLVHVVSSLGRDADANNDWGVAAAGGARRDPHGRWSAGCLQTRLRNHALRVRRGYRHSALDCMLCDHLEGPFLARTSLLKEVPFSKDVPAAVLFEDWFLRVKRRGGLVAACPDSMFFVGSEAETTGAGAGDDEGPVRDAWRTLARAWQVDRVLLPGLPTLRFRCEEVHLSCDARALHKKGLLIPSCCQAQVAGALKAFEEFAGRHALDYELNEGSLLGAVKLQSFLPWDIDGDILIKYDDYEKYKEKKDEMEKLGYQFTSFTEKDGFKYFIFNTPDVSVDMWCRKELSTFVLPKEVQIPTKVRMVGIWMRGSWNPGLLARNRYGPGYLKHALHWSKLGMANHMDAYSVGSWGNCSLPNHHSCLNRYPTEGSFDLLPVDCQ